MQGTRRRCCEERVRLLRGETSDEIVTSELLRHATRGLPTARGGEGGKGRRRGRPHVYKAAGAICFWSAGRRGRQAGSVEAAGQWRVHSVAGREVSSRWRAATGQSPRSPQGPGWGWSISGGCSEWGQANMAMGATVSWSRPWQTRALSVVCLTGRRLSTAAGDPERKSLRRQSSLAEPDAREIVAGSRTPEHEHESRCDGVNSIQWTILVEGLGIQRAEAQTGPLAPPSSMPPGTG